MASAAGATGTAGLEAECREECTSGRLRSVFGNAVSGNLGSRRTSLTQIFGFCAADATVAAAGAGAAAGVSGCMLVLLQIGLKKGVTTAIFSLLVLPAGVAAGAAGGAAPGAGLMFGNLFPRRAPLSQIFEF